METIDMRKVKGQYIADSGRVVKTNHGWKVPSQSGHGAYIVHMNYPNPSCTCPDHETRKKPCKHIIAVEIILKKETDKHGNTTITHTKKITYSQDWHAYDEAKTNERFLFLELLNDLCKDIPNPEYKFGRPTIPLSEMIFASALKVYTTFTLRKFMGDIEIAKERKYIDSTPCYSSIGHFMQKEKLTPILLELILKSSVPLKEVEHDFSVDSTGFSTCRYGQWYSFKYGRDIKSKVYIKAHVMVGVKTHVVTSVTLTEGYDNDSPYLPELVKTTSQTFQINEVSADKAYSGRNNMNAIVSVGGQPYIPFKDNAKGRALGSPIWSKMYHYFMFNRDEFLEHYHKRSNVETVFHMIKSKFGDNLRSKSKTAQINETLLKILCHNICVVIQEVKELGITAQFDKNFFNN